LAVKVNTASPALLSAGVQAQAAGARESRPEGSTFFLRCPYTAHTSFPSDKAWCRMTNGECDVLAETYNTRLNRYINQDTRGKVTIRDDIQSGTIFITMNNLQLQDSGTYSCAYQQSTNVYVLLKTISLHVFKEVHKRELDSLTVQCPYGTQVSSMTKGWCREEGDTSCNILVSINSSSTQRYFEARQHRTTIWDKGWDKTVTITMEKLQEEDSGVYWCVLDTATGRTQTVEVRLTVSKSEYLSAGQRSCLQLPAPLSHLSFPPVLIFILLYVVLGILLIVALISVVILCIKRRRQLGRGNRQAEDIHDNPEDTEQITEQLGNLRKESKELKYITLNFISQLSTEEPLYANVGLEQAPRNSKAETVEYANIVLK
ncbi:PIGR protein, partial [Eudromia elegans]|nr:PIGR protein [Eudromia elegans]